MSVKPDNVLDAISHRISTSVTLATDAIFPSGKSIPVKNASSHPQPSYSKSRSVAVNAYRTLSSSLENLKNNIKNIVLTDNKCIF